MIEAARKIVSRRMFLKSAPAVPLAAPSLAQAAVSGEQAVYGGMAAGHFGPAGIGDEYKYLTERKSKLLSILGGKPDEREEYRCDQYARNRALAYHYDGLRSVSPIMRAHYFSKAQARLRQHEARGWAKFELDDLMKRIVG